MKNIISINESHAITTFCENYGIEKYTINPNGTIDVNEDVYIKLKSVDYIFPIKFNKVDGDFAFSSGWLGSLENCPNEVTGDFDCSNNSLESLKGGPEKVGGNFYCNNNSLTDLNMCPKEVGGNFSCIDNMITTMEYAPQVLKGNFYFYDNKFKNSLFNVSEEENDVFNKYHKHYDFWKTNFDIVQFKLLVEDIKDGLR